MAEGWLKYLDNSLEVYSAGTKPAGSVNPNAVRVMAEAGIDISDQKPDHVEKYLGTPFDFVISVCDNARETCPVFTGRVGARLHHSFEDPWEARGSEEEILAVYRKVRDELKVWFTEFYNKKVRDRL